MNFQYLYFSLLLFTFIGPFSRSFEPKINYISKWRPLCISILIVSIPFIIWDILFTHLGIWGFNKQYITGFKLFSLPIEEFLYFYIIPYACIFIFEVFVYYCKSKFEKAGHLISLILIITLFTIGFFNLDKAYTSTTFIALATLIILLQYILKVSYIGKFYMSFIFILIPFYIVNGVLTGSFIENEVVWYNNNENLNLRIFTIPIEDHFYGMLQILATLSIYTYLKKMPNQMNILKFNLNSMPFS